MVFSHQSDLKVSPLVFGGNVFGWTVDTKTSFSLIDAWLDAGLNTIDTADGLLERDWDKVKTSGRSLAKVVAVSTIAIGVVDAVDGVDTSGAESLAAADSSTVADSTQIENYNVHDVSPHERVLPNGDVIWVDGDGDTSVDRDTGWTQTNPNYRA